MSIDKSGPAFPRPLSEDDARFRDPERYHAQEGMTMRAYFAGKFCAAMVNTIRSDYDYNKLRHIAMAHDLETVSQFFAQEACEQADALIAELAK